MSETPPVMPPDLRSAITADLKPVKPLLSPGRRALLAAPFVIGILAMPLAYHRMREIGDLGVMLSWVPVALQVLLAFGLLVIALREGIPGWRVSTKQIFAVVLVAYSLQIIVNLLIFMRMPMDGGGAGALAMWMSCFGIESLIGIPILVLVAWMVSRALPSRPLLAGFLAGTGAGFAAEASWRMFCAYSDPGHVLLGHTGGILIMGLTGFLLGYVWSVYQDRAAAG
ncbi:MAG: DUF1109 family protein [Acidobacteria bacterium]|nr:DUF1109 family protein [Acidobacteriota bacterium]